MLQCVRDPANPTASVLDSEELLGLAARCAEHRCILIIDETYERLILDDRTHNHPWTVPELRKSVLTIGSFSKSLGMAGWRLGYLFGHKAMLEEAYKVHDSVAICSPLPAQALLKETLEGPYEPWMRENLSELHRRRRQSAERLGQPHSFFRWRRVAGGIFSLMSYQSEIGSLEMARRVLERTGIVLVPGVAFGPAGEHHLRLSFGSSTAQELTEALEALVTFDI
jgi:aspartate/methionine/tyrosine aminotransferase